MNKSDEINELAKSLSKVQGEIHNAFKDKSGYGYKYVDLASILDITRPLLSKHGLSVTQLCGSANDMATVETVLMHESGQWLSSTIEMSVERGKGMSLAQSVGSVITYARRYALAAIVGIAQTDDDASLKGPYEAPQDFKVELEALMCASEDISSKVHSWLLKKNISSTNFLSQEQASQILLKLKEVSNV